MRVVFKVSSCGKHTGLKLTEARILKRLNRLGTKKYILERRHLKWLQNKTTNQGGSRDLISGLSGVQRSETRPYRAQKLGPGGQVWERQMKDEGMWKKGRTGVGAEKGRKACHVNCGKLAENLYSLKYSPKTSAAQYFHCSKYQWKALPKASTSFFPMLARTDNCSMV